MSQLTLGFVAISRCEFVFFQITLLSFFLKESKNDYKCIIQNTFFHVYGLIGKRKKLPGFIARHFRMEDYNGDKV